jgi:hypothetical protein
MAATRCMQDSLNVVVTSCLQEGLKWWLLGVCKEATVVAKRSLQGVCDTAQVMVTRCLQDGDQWWLQGVY